MIQIEDFQKEMEKLLAEYGDEVNEKTKEIAPNVAKKAVKDLKSNSPSGASGRYKKGWASKIEETRLSVTITIYNKTRYYLTHLLENGHAKRGGGRVGGISHIAPVNDSAQKEFLEEIEKAVRG